MATAVNVPGSAPAQKLDAPTYQNWRKTGELTPTAPPEPKEQAESATAASESAAVSETAPSTQETVERPKPKPRSNAESRIRELLAENKRLQSVIETAATQPKETKSAESSPAKAKVAEPVKSEAPKKPKQEDFQDWNKYEAARDQYFEDLADYKSKEAVRKSNEERIQSEQSRQMQEKLTEARQRYPDYDSVAGPVMEKIFDNSKIAKPVQALVEASPVFVDLLYVIGGDPADLKDYIQTAETDPIAAIRKTVLLEQLVIEELTGKKADTEDTAQTAGKPTALRRITKAPPPPTELGGKAGIPENPIAAAVEKAERGGITAGVREYRDAANRVAIAARKDGIRRRG